MWKWLFLTHFEPSLVDDVYMVTALPACKSVLVIIGSKGDGHTEDGFLLTREGKEQTDTKR